jgi:phosphoribosyl-AMP cyclohydrolase
MSIVDKIDFDRYHDGLVPAVVQDAATNEVLMLAYMNRDALRKTLETGLVTFWKRSSQKLWTKGETSGNVLRMTAVRVNCEDNSLLILADPVGPTCHTGHTSCYYREVTTPQDDWREISCAEFDPNVVYRK